MLSKDKIRLMTDLAIYEKHHDNDVFKVTDYFRSDYIFWNTILSAVRYTIAFALIFMSYILLNTEVFFYNINFSGFYAIFQRWAFIYLGGLLVYTLISIAVYSSRYKRARRGMLFYATKLKRLSKRFFKRSGTGTNE